jgi:hypothetical protein
MSVPATMLEGKNSRICIVVIAFILIIRHVLIIPPRYATDMAWLTSSESFAQLVIN